MPHELWTLFHYILMQFSKINEVGGFAKGQWTTRDAAERLLGLAAFFFGARGCMYNVLDQMKIE